MINTVSLKMYLFQVLMVFLLFVILTFSSALLRYAPGSFYGLVIWGWWWIWWWWRWWHRHEVRRYNLVISQCIVRPKNVSSSYFWAYPVSLWNPRNHLVLQNCNWHWWDDARWDLLGPHYHPNTSWNLKKYIWLLKQMHKVGPPSCRPTHPHVAKISILENN